MFRRRASTASATTASSTMPPEPATSRASANCSPYPSSQSMPSRPPPQTPKSRKRQSMPALAAAAACASSRPSCRGNSPSNAPPRFRDRSGSTPHDDDLRATTQKKPSAHRGLPQLAMPQLASTLPSPPNSRTNLQRHTGRRSQNRLAPKRQRHLPPLIPPRCRPQLWPAHRQIPIAERATPPNTCPFPRFRPLQVFGRRPLCGWKRSRRPASENLHITGSGRPVPTTTFRGGWHILKSAQLRSTRSIAMCFAASLATELRQQDATEKIVPEEAHAPPSEAER